MNPIREFDRVRVLGFGAERYLDLGWTGRLRLVVDGRAGLVYLRKPGGSTGW